VQRLLVALSRRSPLLACRIAGPILARDFDPRRPGALERMKRSMSSADAALLDDPLVAEAVLTDAAEAIRQGTLGVAWDIMLYSQSWGFRLEEVKVPVHLWHGEADITIPAHFGRAMAEALERCDATFWPDEGHLMCASRATDIIEVVTATVPSLRAQQPDPTRRPA
jgi:pimeloyl-ACP methyl ester carboxylesterase